MLFLPGRKGRWFGEGVHWVVEQMMMIMTMRIMSATFSFPHCASLSSFSSPNRCYQWVLKSCLLATGSKQHDEGWSRWSTTMHSSSHWATVSWHDVEGRRAHHPNSPLVARPPNFLTLLYSVTFQCYWSFTRAVLFVKILLLKYLNLNLLFTCLYEIDTMHHLCLASQLSFYWCCINQSTIASQIAEMHAHLPISCLSCVRISTQL